MDRTVAAMPILRQRAPRSAEEQPAASVKEPQAAESPTRRTAGDQVVVGAVPRQPPGFQPRPDLMAQLNRTDAGVSVIHAVTEGVGKTQLAAAYARAKLAQGWRLVAWVNARNIGSLLAGLSTTADVMGLSDADSGGDTADLGRVLGSAVICYIQPVRRESWPNPGVGRG